MGKAICESLDDLGKLIFPDDEEETIDGIFSEFDAQFKSGNFETFDRLIGEINVGEYSTDVLITLATVGAWARPELKNRADFARRVDKIIKERNEPEDDLMIGLL